MTGYTEVYGIKKCGREMKINLKDIGYYYRISKICGIRWKCVRLQ